jgi:hypothetical protein
MGSSGENVDMESVMTELIHQAALMVVEEGLDYGQAKRRAAQQLGAGRRLAWPDNDVLEEAVFEHLRLFHADTQPRELLALRQTASHWMKRLAALNPHLCGAVWRGTATRLSPIHLQLFCNDPKAAEWQLLDMGVDFELAATHAKSGEEVDVLQTWVRCEGLGEEVSLLLTVLDLDDVRGQLKPDARGRTRMGSAHALQTLLESAHD